MPKIEVKRWDTDRRDALAPAPRLNRSQDGEIVENLSRNYLVPALTGNINLTYQGAETSDHRLFALLRRPLENLRRLNNLSADRPRTLMAQWMPQMG